MKTKMFALVAGCLLALAASALATDNLSPESVLPLQEERDAYDPCAAFVKDVYIVAWQSGHLAPGDLRDGIKFQRNIVGCRVDKKSGKALDAQPFVICKADDSREAARAAAGPEMALVVWHDLRNGRDWDVYAARVTANGKVLDPDGFLISGGAKNQKSPVVAWDGRTFVVVWLDGRSGRPEPYAARVSADGKVLDADGIGLMKHDDAVTSVAAASNGNGRTFIYCTYSTRLGSPRGSQGTFLADGKPEAAFGVGQSERGENFKALPGAYQCPAFAAAGESCYLLAWRSEWGGGSRGNATINSNALLFDEKGQGRPDRLTLAGADHRTAGGDLAWDGGAFTAAWTEYRMKDAKAYENHPSRPVSELVFVSRLGPDGKVVTPSQLVAGTKETPAIKPCVASDGVGGSLVAYMKLPETGEVPIKIGFRMLRAAP